MNDYAEWRSAVADMGETERAATENEHWRTKGMYGPDEEETTAPSIEHVMRGGIPEAQYHADKRSLSFSGAKLLLPPSNPRKFREYRDNPPKPKREYDFGHLVHKLILKEGNEIVPIDAPDFRTKAAREARDEAHAADKVPVLLSELERAQIIAQQVHQHPAAGPLLQRGHPEMSLYAQDPLTGVELRGRIDWLTLYLDRLTAVEVKTSTTAEPEEFSRKGGGLRYHMQGAWYLDLLIALKIDPDPAFVTIVLEKDAPFCLSVVKWDAEAIHEGRRRKREAIDIYARCVERSAWPSWPNNDTVQQISLPPWMYRDADRAAAQTLITELEGITE